MWPRRMRDDAVLRRALPLGRGLGRTGKYNTREYIFKTKMFSDDVVGLSKLSAEMWVFEAWILSKGRDRNGIPDDWCCNVNLWWLSSGPWHNHVSMLSRLTVWPDRDVGHWNTDVPKIRWTRARTQSKAVSATLKLVDVYSLRHRQPVKDIMKDRSDVVILVKLAGTNNLQTGGGVKHYLQVAGVDTPYSNSVIIVNPRVARLQPQWSSVGCQGLP